MFPQRTIPISTTVCTCRIDEVLQGRKFSAFVKALLSAKSNSHVTFSPACRSLSDCSTRDLTSRSSGFAARARALNGWHVASSNAHRSIPRDCFRVDSTQSFGFLTHSRHTIELLS